MRGRLVVFAPGLTEVGGAARRSALLVETLAERGWHLRVVTRAGTLKSFRFRSTDTVRVVEVPGFGRRVIGALLFFAVGIPLGLAWAARADALLSIQLYSQTTAAALCSRILRRPFIALTTGSGALGEAGFILRSRFSSLRRWILSGASYLVAQTPAAADELSAFVPGDHIAIIPNPTRVVDPLELSGHPRVLFAGRFSEEKDLPKLLEAWKAVATRDEEVRLTLAGAGGSFRSVEAIVRSKVEEDALLTKTVDLPGWVGDLDDRLQSHDVFVLPSRSEGMSNALLEACARGRVVVASDISPNVWLLGEDYPLLFRAGDTSSLADALDRALHDSSVRSTARSAVLRAAAKSAPDQVAAQIEGLLDASTGSRNKHP